MRACIFPGSFDPPTVGHLDIITRLSRISGSVLVAVGINISKSPLFTTDERVALLRTATAHLPNVSVTRFNGLLVDFARANNVTVICKGVRTSEDTAGELRQAHLNRMLDPEIETVLLPVAPQYMHVSSTAVREISGFGGDVASLLPASIVQTITARLAALRQG